MKSQSIVNQVAERVQEHGRPQKIVELCLDEIQIVKFDPEINAALQKCKNLEHLSAASCGLNSLQNFPKIANLRYLDLQQNALTDECLAKLSFHVQSIEGLNISKNSIAKLESIIQCVNKLSIREINIFQTNIFESSPKIIESLFENCKTLQCINWQDRRGKEVKQYEGEEESSSESESQNNEKNYSDQNQNENNSYDEEISMQSSKKVKVQ